MSKARFAVISVVCLMLMAHISCETVECISGAPQTFEENEMLEFVKDCMLRTTRYEITYKYAALLTQNHGGTTSGWLSENSGLPPKELFLEADDRHLRKNEAYSE